MGQVDISRFDENMKTGEAASGGVVWLNADDSRMRLDGFAFRSAGEALRRLPFELVTLQSVQWLAGHTSGGMLTFRTNSRRIFVRASLRDICRKEHMPMTGCGGFDLYLGPAGHRSFVGVTRFDYSASEYEVLILERRRAETEEFQLNFPLYSGVESFALGIDGESDIALPDPWTNPRPVVVYGSSITQGACASRPGSSYTSILSRELDRPVLNFGFSGSGKGEPEVVSAIAKVPDPALILLDYEANASAVGIECTLADAIDILRRDHPRVPILVLSRIRWNKELIETGSRILHDRDADDAIAFQREEVKHRRAEGDHRIFFRNGDSLTEPDWWECTVDGVHPTDFGFHRMAANLRPVIREILSIKSDDPD